MYQNILFLIRFFAHLKNDIFALFCHSEGVKQPKNLNFEIPEPKPQGKIIGKILPANTFYGN